MSTIATPRVPVVLPLVAVRINEDGVASVVVDGAPFGAADQIGRETVERVVHEIAAKLGPVRVRVSECDESVFTDVVLPADSHDGQEAVARPAPGLAGEGFLPDEQVDIAVIIAQLTADAEGRALLRLPAALLAGRGGTVVLLGRTTGTVTVCPLP